MEQTPFDPFKDAASASTSAPDASPTRYAPFDPTVRVDALLPPSRPQRGRNPALWAVPLVALLVVGGIGFSVWQRGKEERAREDKLAALRADIKKIVLQDNALIMELLDDGALEHITYAEFFKRADKNKEQRDELVRNLRATETGPYGEAVGHYIELLETENKWVRAEEAVSNASLDASTKWDTYRRALRQTDDVSGQVQSSYQAYLAAPYGYDFGAKMNYDAARASLQNTSDEVRANFAAWSDSQSNWNDKKRAASVVIADWLRNEPLQYLGWAPKRDVARLLITRKADYASAPAVGNASPKASAKIVPVEAKDAPTDAGALSPTRIRAAKPLDGERFSATRMEDLGEDYASNLSDADLRYAINEMYARYGLTFHDKSLQSRFETTTWYHPNDKWTIGQVKAAFSKRERDNLDALVSERDSRRDKNDESSNDNSNDNASDNASSDNSDGSDNSSADGNESSDSSNDGSRGAGGRTVESGE